MPSYVAPIRCVNCGCVVNQKPGAKTPKYCPPCRHTVQTEFKNQAKKAKSNKR